MSLRWRVVALAVVTAVVGILVGAGLARAVHRSDAAAQALTGRWSPAALASASLLAHLVDQETGERGYLITGDRSYLQPYERGQQLAAQDLSRLRVLLRGDVAGTSALDDVVSAMADWRRQAAGPEIESRSYGTREIQFLVRSGLGKTLFDKVRGEIDDLRALVEHRRMVAVDAVRHANSDLTRWLWINGAVSLLVGAGVLLGLALWVLRPIRRLSESMRRVSAGDLEAPVAMTGPAEIADTGASADAMRRRILTELERSEESRQALEQRGPVVVALSQQLSARVSEPLPGVRYSAVLRPAEGLLAGDWVDVLPLPRGRVALMLLDVSGHGAAAGLEAMRLKTVLTTVLRLGRPPHEALAQAAAGFSEDERFATAVVVVLDPGSGELRWANAGHLAPRLVPLNARAVISDDLEMLRPTGPLLSSLTSGWETKTAQLKVGEMLLAFSDGLTEARDTAGHEFGMDGICRALSETTVRDVDTAVSVCLAAVRAHAVDVHRDDITLLAVTRDPSTMIPADELVPDAADQLR